MSSATLDPHIIEFVSSKIKNLEVVSSRIVSPAIIKHNYVVVLADRKTEAVLKVLESNRADDGSLLKAIIFVLKKELCDSLNEVQQEDIIITVQEDLLSHARFSLVLLGITLVQMLVGWAWVE